MRNKLQNLKVWANTTNGINPENNTAFLLINCYSTYFFYMFLIASSLFTSSWQFFNIILYVERQKEIPKSITDQILLQITDSFKNYF